MVTPLLRIISCRPLAFCTCFVLLIARRRSNPSKWYACGITRCRHSIIQPTSSNSTCPYLSVFHKVSLLALLGRYRLPGKHTDSVLQRDCHCPTAATPEAVGFMQGSMIARLSSSILRSWLGAFYTSMPGAHEQRREQAAPDLTRNRYSTCVRNTGNKSRSLHLRNATEPASTAHNIPENDIAFRNCDGRS